AARENCAWCVGFFLCATCPGAKSEELAKMARFTQVLRTERDLRKKSEAAARGLDSGRRSRSAPQQLEIRGHARGKRRCGNETSCYNPAAIGVRSRSHGGVFLSRPRVRDP